MAIKVKGTIILDELYPLIKEKMSNAKIEREFVKNVNVFFNNNANQLHDIAPYNRIYFNKADEDRFFASIGITRDQIINIIKKCYFYDINFNPECAKDPVTEAMFCIIRFYLLEGQNKKAIMATLYTLLTGKFYASLHYGFWKYGTNKAVMDYVINNDLTDKFDLKKEGTIYKALYKLAETYILKYQAVLKKKEIDDETMTKHMQQLRDREKSFLRNISNAYYEAYNDKRYLNYEFQVDDETTFRITENDAATAARITRNTVNKLASEETDMRICNYASDITKNKIRVVAIKDIMSAITGDKTNFEALGRLINISICLYMEEFDIRKNPIGGPVFISEVIKPTPNTKNKYYIEKKNILVSLIEKVSVEYKRCTREDTRNNYQRAVLTYLMYTVSKVALK